MQEVILLNEVCDNLSFDQTEQKNYFNFNKPNSKLTITELLREPDVNPVEKLLEICSVFEHINPHVNCSLSCAQIIYVME